MNSVYLRRMRSWRAGNVAICVGLALYTSAHGAGQERPALPPKYERVVQEAKAAVGARQYDRAIARLTAALRTNPDQRSAAVLHDERASAYDFKGDLEKAFADANEAIRLAPDYFDGYIQRGLVHRQRGELDQAIRDYDAALRLNPNYVPAYNNRGVAHSRRGDETRAIRDYDEAVRRDPSYANAYMNRAVSHEKLGEFERAIADYSEAIRRNSKVDNAHYNRARLNANFGNFQAAIADANVAIKRDPLQSAGGFLVRARAHRHLGNLSAAKADYARAAASSPATPEGYAVRGSAHFVQGNYPAAASAFSKSLQLQPNDADALSTSAWFLATCPDAAFRDGEKALARSTRACALTNWKDQDALEALAAAYAETGNFERAIHYQAQAMNARPVAPELLKEMKKHLRSYEEHKPYREEPKVR